MSLGQTEQVKNYLCPSKTPRRSDYHDLSQLPLPGCPVPLPFLCQVHYFLSLSWWKCSPVYPSTVGCVVDFVPGRGEPPLLIPSSSLRKWAMPLARHDAAEGYWGIFLHQKGLSFFQSHMLKRLLPKKHLVLHLQNDLNFQVCFQVSCCHFRNDL